MNINEITELKPERGHENRKVIIAANKRVGKNKKKIKLLVVETVGWIKAGMRVEIESDEAIKLIESFKAKEIG